MLAGMTHDLALFDLDNTLLADDSDYQWGRFLVDEGLVDADDYASKNQQFYADYKAGTLDIDAYLRFVLKPLTQHSAATLAELRQRFVQQRIVPVVAPLARALLQRHRDRGDTLVIITATNRFVTEPIATLLEVPNLLATEAEQMDGHYTGKVAGTPCFQAGKITRLNAWLQARDETFAQRWFYSDSHNDVPLLEQVEHPVAVDADAALTSYATQRGWQQMSLRGEALPQGWLR